MKRNMTALLAGVMLMTASSAMALILTVSDGTNTDTYTDGGTGYASSGAINSSTAPTDKFVLEGYTFNISGTETFNTTTLAQVDQDTVKVSYNGQGGASNLTVTLTDDYPFNLALLSTIPNAVSTLITSANVITGATVNSNGYYDTSVPSSTLIGSLGPITSSGTYSTTTAFTAADQFGLTEVVNIAFTGAGSTTSLDTTLNVVPTPEPGTVVLLGIGILGLAVFGKRRMNKEA